MGVDRRTARVRCLVRVALDRRRHPLERALALSGLRHGIDLAPGPARPRVYTDDFGAIYLQWREERGIGCAELGLG